MSVSKCGQKMGSKLKHIAAERQLSNPGKRKKHFSGKLPFFEMIKTSSHEAHTEKSFYNFFLSIVLLQCWQIASMFFTISSPHWKQGHPKMRTQANLPQKLPPLKTCIPPPATGIEQRGRPSLQQCSIFISIRRAITIIAGVSRNDFSTLWTGTGITGPIP